MAYDAATAGAAAALKALDIGPDPREEREREDMARKRLKADTWSPEERDRYFRWRSFAIYIPITNKYDLAKFGDLLCGLGAKLKYIAADPERTNLAALMEAMVELEQTKKKLKLAGKMPTKRMLEEDRKTVRQNKY